MRSLIDVVSKDDFIQDSEYLETLLVAVSRCAATSKHQCLIKQSQACSRRIGIRTMND